MDFVKLLTIFNGDLLGNMDIYSLYLQRKV